MASYYNGGGNPQFNSLDGTTVQGSHYAAEDTTRAGSIRGRFGYFCAVLYFVLISAVAVVAFVLGCYSTDRVRSLRDSVLVSDPQSVPSGYSVFSLGTGLGYWSPSTDMLYQRSDHGVLSYGKYAYLIGGLSVDNVTKNGTVLRKVVRYNTETGLMEEREPLPQARFRFAYALLDDQMYIMGGTNNPEPSAAPFNTVYVYDVVADKWKTIGQLNTPRSDACGAAANGKVYVFGGYDAEGVSLATVEVCDPSTAVGSAEPVCRQLPARSNLKVARADCRAVSIDNVIYAVGGNEWFNNTGQNCTDNWVFCYRFLKSVEAFDPQTGVWSFRAPMISPRGDFGIEVLPGGRIIVAGGEKGNGTHNALAMYEVEEYIVEHDIWVQKAPLPEARFRDDLAYVDGRVYVFGGNPSCDITDDAPCTTSALKTVFAYFDVQYPRLYAFYKPGNLNRGS